MLCLIDTETCRTLTGTGTANDQDVVVSSGFAGVHAHVDLFGENHVLTARLFIWAAELAAKLFVKRVIKAAQQRNLAQKELQEG